MRNGQNEKNMSYKHNDKCLVCTKPISIEFLDLGNQPLANSYHKGESLKQYPLTMKLCSNCWHSQLSVSVDPKEMFEHYLYVSDTSKTLTQYFEWVVQYILNKTQPKKVFEIACNSGLLLAMFQKQGYTCCGVDPAKNLRELSAARNLDVYVDYWNQSFADKLRAEKGLFDLILAFHVLPHVQNPNDFVAACKSVLSDKGQIFIQTSQCDMLLNNEFDVIYHEHSSYFTGKSIQQLARNHGLFVSSIVKTDIHSKSFLFSLQKDWCNESQLNELIKFETEHGIYGFDKYVEFRSNAAKIKKQLIENLTRLKNEGYVLIGYGAAAKGNTLLNYINYKLDHIIDDNPMKCGYLTPGMDIPICSIDVLKNDYQKVCFVPLAWNFYAEIKSRIQQVRNSPNDVYIKYFPQYIEEKN